MQPARGWIETGLTPATGACFFGKAMNQTAGYPASKKHERRKHPSRRKESLKGMIDQAFNEIRSLQKILDAKSEEVSRQLRIPKTLARQRIRRAWSSGCILCKQPGPTDLHFKKDRMYVLCSNCYLERIMEQGEQGLRESIARKLARRSRAGESRN